MRTTKGWSVLLPFYHVLTLTSTCTFVSAFICVCRTSTPRGIRTLTVTGLSRLSLPLEYRGLLTSTLLSLLFHQFIVTFTVYRPTLAAGKEGQHIDMKSHCIMEIESCQAIKMAIRFGHYLSDRLAFKSFHSTQGGTRTHRIQCLRLTRMPIPSLGLGSGRRSCFHTCAYRGLRPITKRGSHFLS
jgi:hypothetical protein